MSSDVYLSWLSRAAACAYRVIVSPSRRSCYLPCMTAQLLAVAGSYGYRTAETYTTRLLDWYAGRSSGRSSGDWGARSLVFLGLAGTVVVDHSDTGSRAVGLLRRFVDRELSLWDRFQVGVPFSFEVSRGYSDHTLRIVQQVGIEWARSTGYRIGSVFRLASLLEVVLSAAEVASAGVSGLRPLHILLPVPDTDSAVGYFSAFLRHGSMVRRAIYRIELDESGYHAVPLSADRVLQIAGCLPLVHKWNLSSFATEPSFTLTDGAILNELVSQMGYADRLSLPASLVSLSDVAGSRPVAERWLAYALIDPDRVYLVPDGILVYPVQSGVPFLASGSTYRLTPSFLDSFFLGIHRTGQVLDRDWLDRHRTSSELVSALQFLLESLGDSLGTGFVDWAQNRLAVQNFLFAGV